jgi:hypothetical protein
MLNMGHISCHPNVLSTITREEFAAFVTQHRTQNAGKVPQWNLPIISEFRLANGRTLRIQTDHESSFVQIL